MDEQAQVQAEILLLSSESGGRSKPIISGYRPQLHLEGDSSDWIMHIHDVKPSPLEPGSSGSICFDLLSWETVRSRLKIGMPFKIREGSRVIATGEITALSTNSAISGRG
jgi:translation elongation factor EF-Tu-like GTPase